MAKRKVNKSEAIRAYQKDHPSDGPTAVADAVSKQLGVKISASFVSNVKSNSGGGKGKGKRKAKRGRGRAASNGKMPGAVACMMELQKIIDVFGAEDTKQAVDFLTQPKVPF